MRVVLLLVLSAMAVITPTSSAQRDTSCDDTKPMRLGCNVMLADPDTMFDCGQHQILALQEGCYRCVDAKTCSHHDAATAAVQPPNSPHKAMEKNSPELESLDLAAPEHPTTEDNRQIQSGLVALDLPFNPDALSTAESAQLNAANVNTGSAFGKRQTSQEVSNWYFMVPAMLAVVSLGIAVRSRIDQRAKRFNRLHDDDDGEDGINPFCETSLENPQEDAGDLEFTGRTYEGASDEDMCGEEDLENGGLLSVLSPESNVVNVHME